VITYSSELLLTPSYEGILLHWAQKYPCTG